MRKSLLLLLLCTGTALAQDAAVTILAPADPGYAAHARSAELLRTLERQHGFSAEELLTVRTALAAAQRLPKLVEQEQKAPEKTETWTQYSRRINDKRIEGGLQLLRDYAPYLDRAEAEFGVPAAVIAAILGVETLYGRITGNVRVLDSLATQGFDHPTRSAFFFSELTEYFAFCRDFGFAPDVPAGSYAGAMGAAQFMPSNYRRLAVDYDGDGRRDLWNIADAIGSIGRYFNEYRPAQAWRRGEPLILRARLERELPSMLERNGKQPGTTIGQLAAAGVRTEFPLPAHTPAGLIELPLDDGSKEYWIGLSNFYGVMTYNPRIFYAMAVSQLAARVGEQQVQP